jgi:hypothetical protein
VASSLRWRFLGSPGATDSAGAALPPAAIEKDATLEGSVTIEAKLGPNGEVTSSAATETKGLTPEVTDCVANRVKSATFPAPGDKGATIQILVAFRPGS